MDQALWEESTKRKTRYIIDSLKEIKIKNNRKYNRIYHFLMYNIFDCINNLLFASTFDSGMSNDVKNMNIENDLYSILYRYDYYIDYTKVLDDVVDLINEK